MKAERSLAPRIPNINDEIEVPRADSRDKEQRMKPCVEHDSQTAIPREPAMSYALMVEVI